MKKVPKKLVRHSHYDSIKTHLHGVVYDSLNKNDILERGEMIEDYKL